MSVRTLYLPSLRYIATRSKLASRKTLANSPYLITHEASSTLKSACAHHFLHPLSWMRPTLSESLLAGRLECPNPKCEAQVGRYAWQGMRCSCGVWVCPAFSLQKGRVDEVTVKPIEVRGVKDVASDKDVVEKMRGLGIRLPPGMSGAEKEAKENL
jgi:dual specificity phosphatase 12